MVAVEWLPKVEPYCPDLLLVSLSERKKVSNLTIIENLSKVKHSQCQTDYTTMFLCLRRPKEVVKNRMTAQPSRLEIELIPLRYVSNEIRIRLRTGTGGGYDVWSPD